LQQVLFHATKIRNLSASRLQFKKSS
jgi:hypothetical protein